MRLHTAIASTLVLAGSAASAQSVVATPKAPMAARGFSITDSPRAAIGVSTSAGTGSRDTLGLLVSSVTRESPAEKAGIEEGNRITMINGVSLKLAPADLGDPDMERLMSRRLTRELDKLKPGDEVNLSVYGNGQTRAIKVKTVDPDSLYELNRNAVRRRYDERATLGLGLSSTGSKRDTLGVFVMSVDEEGPAAKAGIEEGARISAINGVDLRVARDDAGDEYVSVTRLNRMQRELNKVKAGDAVELRVYQNGQTKTVRATAVTMGELNKTRGAKFINGSGLTIIRSGDALTMEVDQAAIATTVRRAAETAVRATGERLESAGRILDEMGRGLTTTSGTIRWMSNETPAKDTPKRSVIRM